MEVRLTQPQSIARMTNLFIAKTMGGFKGDVRDLYSIAGEKKKKIHKAVLRPWTQEEKEEHERLTAGMNDGQ